MIPFEKFPDEPLSGRFFLVGYLPTAAGISSLLVLLWAGAPHNAPNFSHAWRIAARMDVTDLAILSVAIVLTTIVLQPLQLALVRFFEGYWPGWLAPVSAAAARRQQRRRKTLTVAAELPQDAMRHDATTVARVGAAATRLRRLFPKESAVRPTALGNVLAAAEDRAGRAYGWDAVVAWPRLYPVLGATTRALSDDLRDTVDVAVRVSATATVVGVIAAGLLAQSGWWLLLTGIPLAIGWIAYKAAVQAAVPYGEAIEVVR